MATQYGVQFEALMADVCRDFGLRLVKSWDSDASKEEVKSFVDEAVKNFFGKAKSEDPEPETSKAAVAKGKGKGKKPKCQAVTAKGTPCSKCAVEGSPFCGVHAPKDKGATAPLDKKPVAVKKGKAKAPVAKGKGGKGKKAAEPAPASVKHTHGLDEIDYENCELCKSHGGPFELPEYEAVVAEKRSWADEAEDPEEDGSVYVPSEDGGLSEEDFEEDD